MRWLNSTLKERVNTKNKKEAMKLIDRAAFPFPHKANAQRRHAAELYLNGVINKNGLRQFLNRVAYAVPPVSPVSSPKRPSKGIPIPRKSR
jgi:hypothetical protein